MKTWQRTVRARTAASLAAGLMAVPAVMGASQPTASSPATVARAPQGPALAVTVSDGRQAARPGDLLTYTVTVRDTGSTDSPGVTVTQTLSAGLAFVSASDHGAAAKGRVSWSAGIAAGRARTFHVTAKVTNPPASLLRLSAVACVTPHGSTHPVVCAAHLDRLPAAAAAAARPGRSGPNRLAYIAGGLAVLVLGLLIAVAARRGRLRRGPA
jgi:uncharacterized repeat protein (TIGR01451 family)